MSTAQAAKMLGISVRQVARLVPETLKPAAKGEGPRGAYFFRSTDVSREKKRRDAAALAEGRHGLDQQSSSSTDHVEAATSTTMHSFDGAPLDALLETPSAEKRVEELAGEGVTRTPAGTPTSDSTASPHDGVAGTPAELRPPTQPAGNTTGRAE